MDEIILKYRTKVARHIIKLVVRQGGHKRRITNFLAMFVEEFRKEFSEDNKISGDSFMQDCFDDALSKPFPKSKYEK